jgi:hypothetical protein
LPNDMAAWVKAFGDVVMSNFVNKPTILGENGITNDGGVTPISDLQKTNLGVWYHNLIWAGLYNAAIYSPNYWFSEHINNIEKQTIGKPFANFVSTLDLNKGGYANISATSSNNKLRVFGQKNTAKGKAHLWIQNSDHTWRNVMNGTSSSQTGTVSFTLGTGTYNLEWWNTNTGTTTTQTTTADSTGKITLNISGLTDDTAVKITKSGTVEPTNSPTTKPAFSPTPTTTVKAGDANGDGKVDGVDYVIWLNHYNQTVAVGTLGDFNKSGKVDGVDYVVWLNNYGK